MQEFDRLKQLIAEAEEDVKKGEGGNKAAGTRVRKSMQDIKNAAQEVRKKILERFSAKSTDSCGGQAPPGPVGGNPPPAVVNSPPATSGPL
jgi:hypothetical protein